MSIFMKATHYKSGTSLEEYARTGREANGKPPPGATDFHQGKLKHEKSNFTYTYTESYTTAEGMHARVIVRYRIAYLHYDVVVVRALLIDDEHADEASERVAYLTNSVTPLP